MISLWTEGEMVLSQCGFLIVSNRYLMNVTVNALILTSDKKHAHFIDETQRVFYSQDT